MNEQIDSTFFIILISGMFVLFCLIRAGYLSDMRYFYTTFYLGRSSDTYTHRLETIFLKRCSCCNDRKILIRNVVITHHKNAFNSSDLYSCSLCENCYGFIQTFYDEQNNDDSIKLHPYNLNNTSLIYLIFISNISDTHTDQRPCSETFVTAIKNITDTKGKS